MRMLLVIHRGLKPLTGISDEFRHGLPIHEILSNTEEAVSRARTETHASYFALGAGIMLSLGQVGWDFANGTISADQASFRFAKSAALIGSGVASDLTLMVIKDGGPRGGLCTEQRSLEPW